MLLSGNIWISPSFLKDNFVWYRILGRQSFPPQHINYVTHRGIASMVNGDKVVISQLLRWAHFLLLFSRFTDFGFWHFDQDVSEYGSLWNHPPESFWSSLDMRLTFYWSFWLLFFSNIIFALSLSFFVCFSQKDNF